MRVTCLSADSQLYRPDGWVNTAPLQAIYPHGSPRRLDLTGERSINSPSASDSGCRRR